ncbi:DUF6276 family protein [Halorarum salinum]|uniref:Small CPxCG-related zinc finger protein n=1 Tax=Halorarum salinum TaxID=2743089 RepID=A0A7D5QJ70_9EURY|nr:DUF6276 family protein [Halobaculum salinum]QLG63524.1 hypothetical protein HUG12_18045 [Halobaculum salinum]
MPTCPHCDVELVAFAVPEALREHAPDGAAAAAICPRCLRVTPREATGPAGTDPEFGRVHDAFPRGEGGIAVALLLGALPKLTLKRDSIAALREAAEGAGVDVELTLDRVVGADVDPHFDLERRVGQFGSLLG